MDKRLVKIGEAAALIGSTPATLRKWEATGELISARKTKGGTRYYNRAELLSLDKQNYPTIGYVRVSSYDQKNDLDRQHTMVEGYCAAKGWRTEIIRDLGSGMNYRKKGLNKLLLMILRKQMKRLVLTHKDRLLRFGAELIFALCAHQGIEIVLIHKGEQPTFEEELAQDVLEITTVFSARLYGSRSHKNKKLIKELENAARSQSAIKTK